MNRRKGPRATVQASARPPLALYRPDLAEALGAAGVPAYRYDQVYEHLFQRASAPFAQATALPGDLRSILDALGATTLELVDAVTAADGTVKLLLAGRDGIRAETVIMPYRRRVTACISSQAGCPVGCAFCATGALGFRRNLSAAEIVDQVRAATVHGDILGSRISNIVYMGMGEPLLNLGEVLDSIAIICHPRGFGLSRRSISISTVGIPRGILRLAQTEPQVNLAISLHAPDDRTRERLIPARHLHPISEVLAAAWEHFGITGRKLLVEYVLLQGINDSTDDARRLAALLRGHVVTVNLLRLNPVDGRRPRGVADAAGAGHRKSRGAKEGDVMLQPYHFTPSPPPVVRRFRDTLISAHIEAVIRQSKGADIRAACGQLAGRPARRRPDGP